MHKETLLPLICKCKSSQNVFSETFVALTVYVQKHLNSRHENVNVILFDIHSDIIIEYNIKVVLY